MVCSTLATALIACPPDHTQVIDALKAAGVEFLVAPYEADAQVRF